ncbi:esterase [Devosia pacifica]|uniref:Esterase n=1 Tax=Devosia pacifica TaxID=1335967 RepID=A0A918VNV7_9HYPH|nr:serine hydrolase domain-containing protein [Devosia pacifica]GHA10943.1 esterase [Devosia pacifica]
MTLEAMKDALDQAIDSALGDQRVVGTVIRIAREGDEIYAGHAGLADREAGVAIQPDTIFRLASVTKPIVAATALCLVEDGKLKLDAPVSDYLPYFHPKLANGTEPRVTIHHLLTHTAGISYRYDDPAISRGLENTDLGMEETFTRLAQKPLNYEPGTAWEYSMAIDVLGAVIAAVEGKSLADSVEARITAPLGMNDTKFGVADPARLAVAYADGQPEPVRMTEPYTKHNDDGTETIFSPARIFNPLAYQSGGAGMAGTAGDILKFLEMLRNGGNGILSADLINAGMQNQIGTVTRDPGMRFGYFGAVVEDATAAQTPCPEGTVTWGGIYGHDWFIDPVNKLSVMIATNTATEGSNGQLPKDIRRAIYDNLARG